MILLASHSVVKKIFVHGHIDVLTIGQVERKEALLIEDSRKLLAVRLFRMKVLRGFTLNKNRIRPLLENRVHRQEIGPAEVLQCVHESAVAVQPLVPPAELRGKGGGDEDL